VHQYHRIDIRNLRQTGWINWYRRLFDWVKERAHLFRGAMFGTLLRNDAQCFIRIGTLIERAFATAQLLALKDQQLSNDRIRYANITVSIHCCVR
jgi:uncharacterized alpha-E superfamily protein